MSSAESIASAFHECSLGLSNIKIPKNALDAQKWVKELQQLMNTDGIEDHQGKGTYFIKAKSLSREEKSQLCYLIDDLCYWLNQADTED